MIFNRVNFNGSLIGGIPEEINQAWKKIVNKEARYRYVIDAATI